jgi:hypothetical protein
MPGHSPIVTADGLWLGSMVKQSSGWKTAPGERTRRVVSPETLNMAHRYIGKEGFQVHPSSKQKAQRGNFEGHGQSERWGFSWMVARDAMRAGSWF